MGQLCCFPFSRDEEKISQKCSDTIKDVAFRKELKPLLDKVMDIKKLLALPETRAQIYKEVFGTRPITGNNRLVLAGETKVLT